MQNILPRIPLKQVLGSVLSFQWWEVVQICSMYKSSLWQRWRTATKVVILCLYTCSVFLLCMYWICVHVLNMWWINHIVFFYYNKKIFQLHKNIQLLKVILYYVVPTIKIVIAQTKLNVENLNQRYIKSKEV